MGEEAQEARASAKAAIAEPAEEEETKAPAREEGNVVNAESGEENEDEKENDKLKGGQRHACRDCNKTFGRLSNLKAHCRKHTGERPYKCMQPGCAKSFRWKSSLSSHMRSHEKHAGARAEGRPSNEQGDSDNKAQMGPYFQPNPDLTLHAMHTIAGMGAPYNAAHLQSAFLQGAKPAGKDGKDESGGMPATAVPGPGMGSAAAPGQILPASALTYQPFLQVQQLQPFMFPMPPLTPWTPALQHMGPGMNFVYAQPGHIPAVINGDVSRDGHNAMGVYVKPADGSVPGGKEGTAAPQGVQLQSIVHPVAMQPQTQGQVQVAPAASGRSQGASTTGTKRPPTKGDSSPTKSKRKGDQPKKIASAPEQAQPAAVQPATQTAQPMEATRVK